jgi:PleD family two-component response regulator
MDGFERCEVLKANPELCEIPVIFLTALDDPLYLVRGFELGGVDYITKLVLIPSEKVSQTACVLRISPEREKMLCLR